MNQAQGDFCGWIFYEFNRFQYRQPRNCGDFGYEFVYWAVFQVCYTGKPFCTGERFYRFAFIFVEASVNYIRSVHELGAPVGSLSLSCLEDCSQGSGKILMMPN